MESESYILETKRLILRKMRLEDVDDLLKIFSDPIAMQYYPSTLNRLETEAWVNRVLASYERHGFGLWACLLKSTGALVGQCGLFFQENIDGKSEVEIGYLFLRQVWNQGFATEAAKACMDYAKKTVGLRRIISVIRPENYPSRRVAEKNDLFQEKEIVYKGFKAIVYAKEL